MTNMPKPATAMERRDRLNRPCTSGGTHNAVTRYGVSSTRLGSCQPAYRSATRRTNGDRNHSQRTNPT